MSAPVRFRPCPPARVVISMANTVPVELLNLRKVHHQHGKHGAGGAVDSERVFHQHGKPVPEELLNLCQVHHQHGKHGAGRAVDSERINHQHGKYRPEELLNLHQARWDHHVTRAQGQLRRSGRKRTTPSRRTTGCHGADRTSRR